MKTPLIIGVSALALLTISATLFAQTTTGASVIAEMKAAARTFTLTADLNAGATGLQSVPLVGKRTGDMLSAAEYNRLLELVSQGGGGGGGAGFEVNDSTTKTRYGIIWNGVSWANTPKAMGNLLVDNNATALDCGVYFSGVHQNCKMLETAAHDFCHIVFTGGPGAHSELNYIGGKRWRLINAAFNGLTGGTIVECYDNAGGGTGGGGGFNWDMCVPEWVGTPTNGTPYTNPAGLKCKYTGTGPGAPGTNYYYLCCPGA